MERTRPLPESFERLMRDLRVRPQRATFDASLT
jgi:hypothetical protein